MDDEKHDNMAYEVKIAVNAAEAAYFAGNNIPYVVFFNERNRREVFPDGAFCVENPDGMDAGYLERVYRRFKGLPWEIAETKRLKIREITVEDVPRLYELYKDSSVARYMEPLFPEQAQEAEYIRQYIKNIYGFYGYGIWAIEEKESGKLIGRAGLENKEGFEGLELGFMLGVEYQHKGYAYEACSAVLEYGISELGQKEYCALVNAENSPSIRLCERLGFKKGGNVRRSEMKWDGLMVEKEFVQYFYNA